LDSLQGSLEQCINILKDSENSSVIENARQREQILEVIREIFDFTEFAKLAVGLNWGIFTTVQKREFTDAFAVYMGNVYLDNLDRSLSAGRISDWSEEIITESKALVRTKVVTLIAKIPVEYRMRKQNGAWRVYDVDVNGVSLANNYQSQFQRFLSKRSPAHLIKKLKEKIKRQRRQGVSSVRYTLETGH